MHLSDLQWTDNHIVLGIATRGGNYPNGVNFCCRAIPLWMETVDFFASNYSLGIKIISYLCSDIICWIPIPLN